MSFEALEVTLETIRALREPLERVRSRDPKLYQQIRTAAASIALNLAEGAGRSGKDRRHHWRIAQGSADELATALRVAEAWGDLRREDATPVLALLDRVLAMLWRLTH